ncbi:MAG: DUF1700 domain-containing protein [Lachnospiraceae bacterium]|nr:DUF1700 domain-containing protein [Lachnospiraceae bacterium]
MAGRFRHGQNAVSESAGGRQDGIMNKNEFIDKLQRALAGGLNSGQVAENVRYYQEYIDSEVRKGKSEDEVMAGLGDPRLLAKSIIEANKRAGTSYGSNREYDEEMSADTRDTDRNKASSGGRPIMLPGWLILLIVTVVVILIIGVVINLLAYFLPVILVGLAVLLIVKVLQSNMR